MFDKETIGVLEVKVSEIEALGLSWNVGRTAQGDYSALVCQPTWTGTCSRVVRADTPLQALIGAMESFTERKEQ